MLRIMIAATLLLFVSATSAAADSVGGRGQGLNAHLRIGTRLGAAVTPQAAPADAGPMHRKINGAGSGVPAESRGMLGFLSVVGDVHEVAVPVSDSVSLGLGYEYLRREDIQLGVAETGSLHDEYSSHSVVLRARWRF